MQENKHPDQVFRREKRIQSLPRPALQVLCVNSQNPQRVQIYADEIFKFLESVETSFQVPLNYLSSQVEISHTSRAFLVDWVVSVHLRFKMLQETLYISVNLIDRYLSRRMVQKKQLQLVGIAALFIASKYEEIYPPGLKELLGVADGAFTKQQLIRMENEILAVIEFQITVPTAWRFLDRCAEAEGVVRNLAEYFLELGLVEFSVVRFKPSTQAAAVVHLAGIAASKLPNRKLEDHHSELKECIQEFCKIIKAASSHPLTTVRDKFLKKKLEVEKFEKELM